MLRKGRELKTDARCFVRKTLASTHVVADITSDRIRPSMDGSRPVDGLMPGALDIVAVQMLLLPMHGGGGGPQLNAIRLLSTQVD
jgi:hypothetical protein